MQLIFPLYVVLFGLLHSSISITKVKSLEILDEASICERDISDFLSSKTLFDHPDLKEVTISALTNCIKSDFFPAQCITDTTEFEAACQALGGQFTTQELSVKCDDSHIRAIISNAPNCVPKSCNLTSSMVKKKLYILYSYNLEEYMNKINRAGKCQVSPDFCETDTFDLLGSALNVFQHAHLRESLAHAYNSCEFDINGNFKGNCLMDNTYFNRACETIGGQMITHNLELACSVSGYVEPKTVQIFNSPNCVAKSCDISNRVNWDVLTDYYTTALELISSTWKNGGGDFLKSSVNHYQHPVTGTGTSSYYTRSSPTWKKKQPGYCQVSEISTEYPKILLPSKSLMKESKKSRRAINKNVVLSFIIILAISAIVLFLIVHPQRGQVLSAFNSFMVHPLSSNGKGDCQLEELELKEEYEDAGNQLEQERTTIV